MAEKGRPGAMLWFDLRPCLKRLSHEEKGLLFECILDYAEYGAVPELEGMTGVAWDFIRPRIDRDAERYEEVVENKRRAARKRWDKQEEEPLTDADGCSSMQVHARASCALQTMPTTTSTPTTKTTPSPTATAASTAAPKPRTAGRPAPDLQAAAGELSFEDLRQRKLEMLSDMMGAGP